MPRRRPRGPPAASRCRRPPGRPRKRVPGRFAGRQQRSRRSPPDRLRRRDLDRDLGQRLPPSGPPAAASVSEVLTEGRRWPSHQRWPAGSPRSRAGTRSAPTASTTRAVTKIAGGQRTVREERRRPVHIRCLVPRRGPSNLPSPSTFLDQHLDRLADPVGGPLGHDFLGDVGELAHPAGDLGCLDLVAVGKSAASVPSSSE